MPQGPAEEIGSARLLRFFLAMVASPSKGSLKEIDGNFQLGTTWEDLLIGAVRISIGMAIVGPRMLLNGKTSQQRLQL